MYSRFKHALCGRGLGYVAYLIAVVIGAAVAGALILVSVQVLV